jgi:hypothetical protein
MSFKVAAHVRRVFALVLVAGCVALPLSLSPGVGPASVSASSPRSGDLHLTKECSQDTYLAGGFCTITSSNLKAITVGSRVVYASAADRVHGFIDSDVVLDAGPGNNTAFGHCFFVFKTATVPGHGLCLFWGGTGKFTHFHANIVVSVDATRLTHWDGTYSFSS